MVSRASDIRDTMLLSAACAVGMLIAPAASFAGLPLAAAGVAGLLTRGRWVAVTAASILGIGLMGALQPSTLAFTLPALIALVVAVLLLPRVSYQIVGVGLLAVFTLAGFSMDFIQALEQGRSAMLEFSMAAESAVADVVRSVQASGGSTQELEAMAKIVGRLWPSAYVQLAALATVLVMAALAWASKRSGRPLAIPPMSKLDLNVNVIWLPIAALVTLAVGVLLGGGTGLVFVVALNLLLIARPLLLLQGLGVSAWLMDGAKIGPVGRAIAYVALVVFDMFVPVISVVGLIDFWANFRKLPRDGQPAPAPSVRGNEN